MDCTKGDWIRGWGNGVTGPTTPAVGGATVEHSIAYSSWRKGDSEYPHAAKFYDLVVAPEDGHHRVIAICPHPNGTDNAHLIAEAPALYESLSKLANEAKGFLAHADRETHGNTNIQVMRLRIKEAFDALAKARGEANA